MSSITTQVCPFTSPTTLPVEDSFGIRGSRILWMKAIGQPPSKSDQRSATRTRPESGETIVNLVRSTLLPT